MKGSLLVVVLSLAAAVPERASAADAAWKESLPSAAPAPAAAPTATLAQAEDGEVIRTYESRPLTQDEANKQLRLLPARFEAAGYVVIDSGIIGYYFNGTRGLAYCTVRIDYIVKKSRPAPRKKAKQTASES